MARDNHIIRPDRPARPSEPKAKVLTRKERVTLLVHSILPDVIAALEARQSTPPPRRKG
ncbi:MAG: hypothetical protein AAFS01_02645 [Pseudomonadota bacterium]